MTGYKKKARETTERESRQDTRDISHYPRKSEEIRREEGKERTMTDTVDQSSEKYILFDGSEEDWPDYRKRIETIRTSKGWWAVTQSYDENIKEDVEMNKNAMTYFCHSWQKRAKIYYQTSETAFEAWQEIKDGYETSSNVTKLVELEKEFANYTCKASNKPQVWFLQLKWIVK